MHYKFVRERTSGMLAPGPVAAADARARVVKIVKQGLAEALEPGDVVPPTKRPARRRL